jgi:hypothetical protein
MACASAVVPRGEHVHETDRMGNGGQGTLGVQTVDAWTIGPDPLSDTQWGAVIWRMSDGGREFRGAYGSIPSNVTVPSPGEVEDHPDVSMVAPSTTALNPAGVARQQRDANGSMRVRAIPLLEDHCVVPHVTKTQEVMTGADPKFWPGVSGAFIRIILGLGRPNHDLKRLIGVS